MNRPRGVTVFSWLILIGSILGVASFLFDQGIRKHFSYFYALLHLFSIVLAIFLLQLKDWARKTILVLSIVFVTGTLLAFPQSCRNYAQENFEMMRQDLSNDLLTQAGGDINKAQASFSFHQEIYFDTTNAVLVAMVLWNLAFNAGVICYFTRPKVKERFT